MAFEATQEHKKTTSEEEDSLFRSNKKPKGPETIEGIMDEIMKENDAQKDTVVENREENISGREHVDQNDLQNPNKTEQEGIEKEVVEENGGENRKTLSYKDKLLGFNGIDFSDSDENEDWSETMEEGEMEIASSGPTELIEEEEDPACPTIKVSKEEHLEMCKPWKSALIIKLMGKRLGMKFLKLCLQKMWNPQGNFEFIDLENNYFLAKFTNIKDYSFVLQEGPWVIAEHYLIVQRWKANFNPYENEV